MWIFLSQVSLESSKWVSLSLRPLEAICEMTRSQGQRANKTFSHVLFGPL